MKYLLSLLIIFGSSTCINSQRDEPKVKKQIRKQYASRTAYGTGEISKGELKSAFEMGFDAEGNQTYSIDLMNKTRDTVWYRQKSIEKIMGDKTCYYRDTTLTLCKLKKGDTVQIFFPPDMDKPTMYEYYDKKGLTGGIFPDIGGKYPYKKSFLSERKFDAMGSLIYYVNTEYYLPEDFDPDKNHSHKTLQKDLLQAGTSEIVEMEFVYYE